MSASQGSPLGGLSYGWSSVFCPPVCSTPDKDLPHEHGSMRRRSSFFGIPGLPLTTQRSAAGEASSWTERESGTKVNEKKNTLGTVVIVETGPQWITSHPLPSSILTFENHSCEWLFIGPTGMKRHMLFERVVLYCFVF